MTDAGTVALTAPEIRVAQTEDGPISLVSLDYLEHLVAQKKQQAADLAAQESDFQSQSRETLAQAGWQLTAHSSDWQSADRSARIDAARGLGQLVSTLERNIAEVSERPHHGIGGVLHRVADARELEGLRKQLVSAQTELDNRYRDVASDVQPPTGVRDADQLLEQTLDLSARATDLHTRNVTLSAEVEGLTTEIAKRRQVLNTLGFDALGIEADLSVNGIRPIATGLVLKAKEVAALDVTATLCRFATKTRYVGASQGVSIPLGHGLRYRVSSYRGQPVQSQYLARVDTGHLVVTNQRLVFLGSKRDVSVPIAKLLHLEPYSDAVGIGREGKESRDVFMVQHPAQLLLYLQWVINHQV